MYHRVCPALFALALLLAPVASRAAEPVDVALVLVDDVSRSIDDSEFALQKQGYAEAFTDARVLAAIHAGPAHRIAVSYVEFADEDQVRTVLDWAVISDAASARAFTARLVAARRSAEGRTAIGSGIDRAVQMLAESPFQATRPVIDVCGDGTSNDGRDILAARDAALAAGITINGLAIINDHPASQLYAHVAPPGGLAKYYRDHVTGGPGSFVAEVHDFHAFGQAMVRKLVSEIASAGATPTGL